MRAEWFDACSALVAFCKHSKADQALIWRFKNTLIRLFSMLHATALGELEELNTDVDDVEELRSFSFDLIDPESIDHESLRCIKFSTSKVELIFTWIQFLIVDNINTGVLSIPPPILSRSFQEIANGMVAFHNAIKITYIPFPFPYAQTCDCLLILHWLAVPLVTSQWVSSPVWAAAFVLVQVFPLWCLNLIAVEIENPFGQDPNDINGRHMQVEMNRHLLLLLQPETIRTPQLIDVPAEPHIDDEEFEDVEIKCFNEVWQGIDGGPDEATKTARKQIANFANCAVASSITPGDFARPEGRKTAFGGAYSGARKTLSVESQGQSSERKTRRAYDSRRMSYGDGMPKTLRTTLRTRGESEREGPGGHGSRIEPTSSVDMGCLSSVASADRVQVRGSWEPVPEEGEVVGGVRSLRFVGEEDGSAVFDIDKPPANALAFPEEKPVSSLASTESLKGTPSKERPLSGIGQATGSGTGGRGLASGEVRAGLVHGQGSPQAQSGGRNHTGTSSGIGGSGLGGGVGQSPERGGKAPDLPDAGELTQAI